MHAVPHVAPHVAIQVLGPFHARGRGAVLGARGLGGGKPRQILELLALHNGSTVSKPHLIALLWPHGAPADAVATVESYVSVLRQHLLDVCSTRTQVVRTGVGGYLIEHGSIDLDLDRFGALVRQAEVAAPQDAYALLEEAITLADAPLLVEEEECPWADEARAAHARRFTRAVVAAAEVAITLGRTGAAVQLADRALATEPHNEAAWCAKLVAFERAGRQVDGLRVYGECRSVLANDLGCSPGARLQAVFQRLLTGAAGAHDDLGDLVDALVRVWDHSAGASPGRDSRYGAATHGGDVGPVRDPRQVLQDLVSCARELAAGHLVLTRRG